MNCHGTENIFHYNVFNDKYLISNTDDDGKDIVAVFDDKKSEYVYENYTIELNVGQISPSGRYFAAVNSFDNIAIYVTFQWVNTKRVRPKCANLPTIPSYKYAILPQKHRIKYHKNTE